MITAAQNINQAIDAYKNVAKGVTGEMPGKAAPSAGEDFASLVNGAIREAVQIGERSEQLSIAGINGTADMTQVVTAVAEAEVTLRTVMSVRDKVVEAYREILRMPM
jgi:flagellar hook-basal body complex protein FliE